MVELVNRIVYAFLLLLRKQSHLNKNETMDLKLRKISLSFKQNSLKF